MPLGLINTRLGSLKTHLPRRLLLTTNVGGKKLKLQRTTLIITIVAMPSLNEQPATSHHHGPKHSVGEVQFAVPLKRTNKPETAGAQAPPKNASTNARHKNETA